MEEGHDPHPCCCPCAGCAADGGGGPNASTQKRKCHSYCHDGAWRDLYGAKSANPGERLFGQKCAFCHIGPSTGKFMLARRLPKDQAELPSRRDLTADYVKAVVRNGLVNMPTFTRVELSDPELAQIADWLARKGRK
jgi:mono/diheme cytochrome c family protein